MRYIITLAIAAFISFWAGFQLTHRHLRAEPVKVRPVPYHPEPTLTPLPILTFLADVQESEGGSSDSDEESEEDEEVDDDEIPEREGDALA